MSIPEPTDEVQEAPSRPSSPVGQCCTKKSLRALLEGGVDGKTPCCEAINWDFCRLNDVAVDWIYYSVLDDGCAEVSRASIIEIYETSPYDTDDQVKNVHHSMFVHQVLIVRHFIDAYFALSYHDVEFMNYEWEGLE